MQEILDICWSDESGTYKVPVSEYNAPIVGNLTSCAPDGGSIPKIDVYKYNETEYELFAWAATPKQMFEMEEQIICLLNPHLGHKHPYVLQRLNRGTGTILEFNCKVGVRNA